MLSSCCPKGASSDSCLATSEFALNTLNKMYSKGFFSPHSNSTHLISCSSRTWVIFLKMLYFPNRAMTWACNNFYSLKSNSAFCAWENKWNTIKPQTLRTAETLTCVKYQVQPTFPWKRGNSSYLPVGSAGNSSGLSGFGAKCSSWWGKGDITP